MKFKTDFVTNSSSASIILIVKSEHKTVEEFREVFNKYIEEYKGGEWGTPHPIHFWDGSKITKKGKDTFQIEDYTSMFNYATDDIPHYMQALCLQWMVDPGDVEMHFGFKGVEIKVIDDN
jgi:hypothetical protein